MPKCDTRAVLNLIASLVLASAVALLSLPALARQNLQCPELDAEAPKLSEPEKNEAMQVAIEIGEHLNAHGLLSASSFAVRMIEAAPQKREILSGATFLLNKLSHRADISFQDAISLAAIVGDMTVALYGREDPRVAAAFWHLGGFLSESGSGAREALDRFLLPARSILAERCPQRYYERGSLEISIAAALIRVFALDEAERVYGDALALLEQSPIDATRKRILAFNGLSQIHGKRESFLKAVESLVQADKVAASENLISERAYLNLNIGLAYERLRNDTLAREHLRLAREFAEAVGDADKQNLRTKAFVLAGLARIEFRAGAFDEAILLSKQGIDILKAVAFAADPLVVQAINDHVEYLTTIERFDEAETTLAPLTEAVRDGVAKGEVSDDAIRRYADALRYLAHNDFRRRQYRRAQERLAESVRLYEASGLASRNPLNYGVALDSLGATLHELGRSAEAEALVRKAMEIFDREPGSLALVYNNYAHIMMARGQYDTAIEYARRAVQLTADPASRLQPGTIGIVHNTFCQVFLKKGNADLAKPECAKAYETVRKAYGDSHSYVEAALEGLVQVDDRLNDRAALERDLIALIQIQRNKYGERSSRALLSVQRLATSLAKAGDLKSFRERAREIMEAINRVDQPLSIWAEYFEVFSRIAIEDGVTSPGRPDAAEAFHALQLSRQTRAQLAIAAAAARIGAGGVAGSDLVRRYEAATAEHARLDERLIDELARIGKERREPVIQLLRKKVDAAKEAVDRLKAEIKQHLPSFGELANPGPIELNEAQTLLSDDEALIAIVTDGIGFSVITLTRSGVWMAHRPDGMRLAALARRLMIETAGNMRAVEKERAEESRGSGFDLAAAHELYRLLLGPVVDAIKDKAHWIIVPDGPLTGVPFQLLLTDAPTAQSTMKDAPWLIRDHAVSMLPAVSSLRALRRLAPKARTATLPFIGFGDPVIGTDPGEVSCAAFEGPAQVAALSSETAVRAPMIDPRALSGGGLSDEGVVVADVDWLRRQPRLAEARCEIEALARRQQAELASSTFVGPQATETKVKELSAAGELKKYRVVAFATHGLLPSEAKGVAEAGLILTPPAQGTAQDDGLLTASEVAALDLDADWAILSACNTAAGEQPGAETLSGLASAFFFAGARSVLVSHWPVESRAAVLLTTRAFAELARAPDIGKAEAMRRAMLSFLAADAPEAWSHPRIWAPFSLVGEGGA